MREESGSVCEAGRAIFLALRWGSLLHLVTFSWFRFYLEYSSRLLYLIEFFSARFFLNVYNYCYTTLHLAAGIGSRSQEVRQP